VPNHVAVAGCRLDLGFLSGSDRREYFALSVGLYLERFDVPRFSPGAVTLALLSPCQGIFAPAAPESPGPFFARLRTSLRWLTEEGAGVCVSVFKKREESGDTKKVCVNHRRGASSVGVERSYGFCGELPAQYVEYSFVPNLSIWGNGSQRSKGSHRRAK